MEEEDFFDNILDKEDMNMSLLDENNALDEYLLDDDLVGLKSPWFQGPFVLKSSPCFPNSISKLV